MVIMIYGVSAMFSAKVFTFLVFAILQFAICQERKEIDTGIPAKRKLGVPYLRQSFNSSAESSANVTTIIPSNVTEAINSTNITTSAGVHILSSTKKPAKADKGYKGVFYAGVIFLVLISLVVLIALVNVCRHSFMPQLTPTETYGGVSNRNAEPSSYMRMKSTMSYKEYSRKG